MRRWLDARRTLVCAVLTPLVVGAGWACRRGEPAGDPKIAPNTPVPDLDEPEPRPEAPPSPGDAG